MNAEGLHISTALSPNSSNSVLCRSLASIFTGYAAIFTGYECNRTCYKRVPPRYEHHAPVMSIMPLLRMSRPVTSLWRVATPNNAHALPFILWLLRNKMHKTNFVPLYSTAKITVFINSNGCTTSTPEMLSTNWMLS